MPHAEGGVILLYCVIRVRAFMEISASKDNNEELPNGNNFEGHAP